MNIMGVLVKIPTQAYEGLKESVKSMSEAYVYDPSVVTHLCESTPSYMLNWVNTVIEFHPHVADSERERIEDECRGAEQYQDYMHCRRVEALNPEDLGEWDDLEEATEYFQGNSGLTESWGTKPAVGQ